MPTWTIAIAVVGAAAVLIAAAMHFAGKLSLPRQIHQDAPKSTPDPNGLILCFETLRDVLEPSESITAALAIIRDGVAARLMPMDSPTTEGVYSEKQPPTKGVKK